MWQGSLCLYYRPQRSCGKIMFSQACVKNSVHKGQTPPPLPSACWDTHTPAQCMLGYTPPPAQCMLGSTPPPPDTLLGRHPRVDTPLGRQPPPSGDHCSRRYASYWNAFLLDSILLILASSFYELLVQIDENNFQEERKIGSLGAW